MGASNDMSVILVWTIDENNRLLGKAEVAGPLVEVLKTHLQSAKVMEQACRALSNVVDDGEWKR